jgi:hypothetical protein
MQAVTRARRIKAAALAALLCGCGAPVQPDKPAEAGAPAGEAGYVEAPSVTAVAPAGGSIRLEGDGPAKAQIRLATPAGSAFVAAADGAGRWRLTLPADSQTRLFGLSALSGGRRVQAQGYVLVAGTGDVALLRAGAGATRLQASASVRLTAVDFDREGAAIVSGSAPPESAVSIRVDARPGPVGRADASGRFSFSLTQPFTAGVHEVQMLGDAFDETAKVDASPAAPLGGMPFRASNTPYGLRVDWVTPGGGLQSTWILN